MAAFRSRDREAFDAHWARILADPSTRIRAIEADGVLAGSVGSWTRDGRRYLGYWIARELWGRGVASRGVALFLGIDRGRPLYAEVAKHNVGSVRVLEKCGFVRWDEGILPSESGFDGVEEWHFRLDAPA